MKPVLLRILGATAIMAGAVVGCSNDLTDYGGFGGGTAFASSSSSSSGSYGDGGRTPNSYCDSVRVGDDCSVNNDIDIACEQGASASSACNTRLLCKKTRWVVDDTERSTSACAFQCPADYTESAPGLCDAAGIATRATLCEYPDGICGCAPIGGFDLHGADAGDAGDGGAEGGSPDAGSIPYEWRCVKPAPTLDDPTSGETKCPHIRPHEGSECVVPITCDYGFCDFADGVQMGCYAQKWIRVSAADGIARGDTCGQ